MARNNHPPQNPNIDALSLVKKPEIDYTINKMAKRVKIKRFLINFFSILLITTTLLALFLFVFAFIPGRELYLQFNAAKQNVLELKTAASAKDLVLSQTKLDELNVRLFNFSKQYRKLGVIGSLPYLNKYYKDGNTALNIAKNGIETGQLLVKAIEPYKDFLGLSQEASDSAQTTQDRLDFLTESVEGLVPHLDTISQKIALIETDFDKINPENYPEEYNGIKIKSKILEVKEMLKNARTLMENGKPIISKASWFLGKDAPRNFFLIFQNDAELRPTGGFWTAYGIIKVNKGKIETVASDDIYSLDARLNSRIPAPRPLKTYHIDVPYFNLRDMNISPDFPTSIELFLQNYNKIAPSKTKLDGVIAIDTEVLVDLVRILGRVGVSGYGNFSADPDKRCDGCPQIIYQLEWLAGRPRNYIELNRKGFLGPLMNSLMANALGAPKEKLGLLSQAFMTNLLEKHLLFYFNDKEMQSNAVLANIAGSISQIDPSIDYLHLNDANMASAKTNLFIKQKIKHEITVENQKVNHKITVTYTNPSRASNCNLEKGDLCLNAPKYRNWFRFYVPTGSKLIKMTGSEIEPVQYEELGKQVFEGFYGDKFPLYAKASLKTSIQYESPIAASNNYSLFLQKQPGTKAMEYEIFVNGKKQTQFSWVGDKTVKLSL